jgi:pimeloyl-ACP methyl ester carboxylesterase
MLMFICLLSAGAVTLMCGGIAEGRPLTRGNRERGYVMPLSPPKLNLKEEHFRVASYIEGLTLFLRYLPPTAHHTDTPKSVLRNPVLGRAEGASQQIERAVGFIRDHHGVPRISIIAHSWGTIAAGRFAGRCPDLSSGPVTWRQKKAEPQTFAAWRLVSLKDQWDRFTAEVPSQEPPVLSKPHFKEWISLHGHRPGQPDSLASERQDAKRAVAGHSHLGSW